MGDTSLTRVDYFGYTLLPGRERDATGWVTCWRITRDGMNVAPGATWFRTLERAKRGVEALVVADGDGDKFWALLRLTARTKEEDP